MYNILKSVVSVAVIALMYAVYAASSSQLASSSTGSMPVIDIEILYQTDVGKFVEQEIMCLSENIYFESGTESDAGKIGVALVTMNRVRDSRWPDTVCGVVKQGPTYTTGSGKVFPRKHRCQFSWYCDGKPDIPYPGEIWKKSQQIAETVYFTNSYQGLVEGATHYHAIYVQPYWTSHFRVVTQIDNHIFYR